MMTTAHDILTDIASKYFGNYMDIYLLFPKHKIFGGKYLNLWRPEKKI